MKTLTMPQMTTLKKPQMTTLKMSHMKTLKMLQMKTCFITRHKASPLLQQRRDHFVHIYSLILEFPNRAIHLRQVTVTCRAWTTPKPSQRPIEPPTSARRLLKMGIKIIDGMYWMSLNLARVGLTKSVLDTWTLLENKSLILPSSRSPLFFTLELEMICFLI